MGKLKFSLFFRKTYVLLIPKNHSFLFNVTFQNYRAISIHVCFEVKSMFHLSTQSCQFEVLPMKVINMHVFLYFFIYHWSVAVLTVTVHSSFVPTFHFFKKYVAFCTGFNLLTLIVMLPYIIMDVPIFATLRPESISVRGMFSYKISVTLTANLVFVLSDNDLIICNY